MHNICDMHSHILPGMDDGSRNADESVQMMRVAYAQGVGRMCATPHYYPVETVDSFLERRRVAVAALNSKIAEYAKPLPEICLGAEVAFRPGLEHEEQLDKLCLGSSRYLLLEMPFAKWGKDVLRSVHNICNRGITPIIAHMERYLSMQNTGTIRQLLQADVLVQMNASQLLRFFGRNKACRLLCSGVVQLLGSDCHNTTSRAPNMGAAVSVLKKRGLEDVLQHINQMANDIFSQAVGER